MTLHRLTSHNGARHIRLWGETIRVAAQVHTIGGLSAHADQTALKNWYASFEGRPPVTLVHGEERSITGLSECLRQELSARVRVARPGEILDLRR
jgi:metallo-beta-lactamase family protein